MKTLPDILPSDTKLPEIPSEFIEPYLKNFLMRQLEYFYYSSYSYEKIMGTLEAIRSFVTHYGGVHSRYATNNIFEQVFRTKEEDLKKLCEEIFNNK